MYKFSSLAITLLIVITATIIIVIGCGGNDNTVSPNISTPTPDPSRTAYITVRVTWPSRGENGSYTISSKSGEELTASITKDTHGIKFFVYDNTYPNDNSKPVIGTSIIEYPNTSTTIKVRLDNALLPNPTNPTDYINLLPPIPVKVRAEAYKYLDYLGEPPADNLISTTEKEYTIKLGNGHSISLNLGDYELNVGASHGTIYLSSNKNVEADNNWGNRSYSKVGALTVPPYGTSTPRPTNTSGTPPTATPTSTLQTTSIITANLKLVIPDDTSGTGTPEPTKTPRPISGKNVTFSIVSGPGTLSSSTGLTDNNGNCSVSFSSDVEGKTIIEAVFQSVEGDPNSIYKSRCEVTTKSQPSKYELHSCILERPNYFVRVPDFKSPYLDPIRELTINTYLVHVSQYDHSSMEGKTFKFSILSGNGTLSSYSGTTPETGVYNIKISTDDEPGPRTIVYKVECDTGEDGVSPLVVTNTVLVKDGLMIGDDFESYSEGTTIDKLKWGYTKLSDDLMAKNHIISGGNGKCVELYSPPSSPGHGPLKVALMGGNAFSFEIRCSIKNGTENTFEIPYMPWSNYFVRGYIYIMEYRYDGNKIYSGKDYTYSKYLGTYGHGWENVRMQRVQISGVDALIHYSPGDGLIRDFRNITSSDNNNKITAPGFSFGTVGGTVWFDDMKAYSFDEGYIKIGTTPTPYSY